MSFCINKLQLKLWCRLFCFIVLLIQLMELRFFQQSMDSIGGFESVNQELQNIQKVVEKIIFFIDTIDKLVVDGSFI